MAKRAAADELGTEKKKMKKADDHDLPPVALVDNDIIKYEILPRLAATSVCRFKSVSKPWKLFLSTHMFGKMHRLRHVNNKTYKLLLLDKPSCQPLLNLNGSSVTVGFNNPLLEEAHPRFDLVLAALDGLVCVASTTKIFASLALWNPLTGAYYKLPPHHKGSFSLYDPHSGLIGFYSDSSNDYKLLHMVFWGAVAAYIYSQRLNSWRKIEFVIENYGECYFDQWSQATFCDHSLYFWVRHYEHDHECIICFDVNTEDFRIIQFPPLPRGATRLHSSLVVIDGRIHLCVAYNIRKDYIRFKRGNMWKLMTGDSWVEVAFFPGAPDDDDDDLSLDIPSPPNVCITRNARDSWLAIMEGNNNSFEIMNMEDFTLKEHSCSSSSLVTYRRIIYEETLVSPNPS